ncbi:helix-turn-helix domain-containing protein [Rhodococcus erythropolis]|uniref:helix-turn-helix domain-containing protein n=1 Tax=Rhodococcus erythropolis TaxID=1833 RepID=UPI001F20D613|nr:helix-turn-helix domain-containing protein [Rhodococcus erythropolis]
MSWSNAPKTPALNLISLADAAAELSVSTRTIRRYIAEGKLEGFRVGSRLIRVTRRSLDPLVTPMGVAA